MTPTTAIDPPSAAPLMSVYDCIVAVSRELAQDGISKTRSNAQQGYKFRGIDDVLNALSPLLAKYRLVILPRIISRAVVERPTQKGGVLFSVTVEAEFDFVSASDGSMHTVKTYGEAMDSADKATNKAMSAAYKYAAFQTFCIPTEGDNDADAVTHEVRPSVNAPAPQPASMTQQQMGHSPAAATVENRGASDDGPVLTDAVLPPGVRLVARVDPGRAGAEAEIIFTNGEHFLTWNKGAKIAAERFKFAHEPCIPDLKKSQSGNWRIEGLVPVPDGYDPPAGLPQVGAR